MPSTDLPGDFRYLPSGFGAAFGEGGRYAFVVEPTVPGAEPSSAPERTDVLRWEWALTTPDAV